MRAVRKGPARTFGMDDADGSVIEETWLHEVTTLSAIFLNEPPPLFSTVKYMGQSWCLTSFRKIPKRRRWKVELSKWEAKVHR